MSQLCNVARFGRLRRHSSQRRLAGATGVAASLRRSELDSAERASLNLDCAPPSFTPPRADGVHRSVRQPDQVQARGQDCEWLAVVWLLAWHWPPDTRSLARLDSSLALLDRTLSAKSRLISWLGRSCGHSAYVLRLCWSIRASSTRCTDMGAHGGLVAVQLQLIAFVVGFAIQSLRTSFIVLAFGTVVTAAVSRRPPARMHASLSAPLATFN